MGAQIVEQVVSMPVINPDTGRPSRTFEYVGKVDLCRDTTTVDWKGTANPHRSITQMKIGCQAECYALALMSKGRLIQQIEYRLIQRPKLEYVAPKFKWAVMRAGRKSAVKVCDSQVEAEALAKAQGCTVQERITGDRDRDAYENRCYQQLLNEPRRMVPHPHFLTESRLKLARQWLWQCCKRILECRQYDRWLPNEKACFAYERECPYTVLCEGIADGACLKDIAETDFEQANPHPELDGHESELTIVTYSSLSTLAMCEVRYFWKYERRLHRQHEDSESLWIGSAMHRGMEVYATDGLDAALAAVDEWADHNPIIGSNQAWLQDQQIARARAMCRAAAKKWED